MTVEVVALGDSSPRIPSSPGVSEFLGSHGFAVAARSVRKHARFCAQIRTRLADGSRRTRASGSLVTIAWLARFAQIMTCARGELAHPNPDYPRHPDEHDTLRAEQAVVVPAGDERSDHGGRRRAALDADRTLSRFLRTPRSLLAVPRVDPPLLRIAHARSQGLGLGLDARESPPARGGGLGLPSELHQQIPIAVWSTFA